MEGQATERSARNIGKKAAVGSCGGAQQPVWTASELQRLTEGV